MNWRVKGWGDESSGADYGGAAMNSTAPAGSPYRSLHRTATTRAERRRHWSDVRYLGGGEHQHLAHGGLRLDGKLPPAGQAQDRYCRQHPEERF